MNTPNYTDAINALTASINGTAREKAAEAARLKARVADEAEALMRPLIAVMESHPDIERIDEAATSPGGASVFRRSYRRRIGSGSGSFRGIVAIKLDPPGVATRQIHIQTDTACINYLSIKAQTRASAVVARADELIPVALDWCAQLLAPPAP